MFQKLTMRMNFPFVFAFSFLVFVVHSLSFHLIAQSLDFVIKFSVFMLSFQYSNTT